jgi:hypothetical protein
VSLVVDLERCCASLPIHGVSMSAWRCSYHQAWSAHVMVTHQDDDDVQVLSSAAQAFGPFDTAQDVANWCSATAHRLVLELELTAAQG